jgi:hypothetical protein
MSRSNRKTSIVAIARAESDKAFKTAEHRRSAVRVAVMADTDPPHARRLGNPHSSGRDGKRHRHDATRKAMRK